jgi:hypothetical protein
MNMGEAVIRVTADLTNFTQQQQQIVSESVSTGEKAARGFSDKFGDYLERARMSIGAKLQKAIEPQAIINSFSNAFRTLNEGGTVGEALEASIKGLPIVGSAYELGKQAGEFFYRAFTEAGQAETRIAEEAKVREGMLADRLRRETMMQQESAAVFGQGAESQRLGFDLAIQQAKAEGDLREAAFQEAKKKEFELSLQLARELTNSQSDQETELIKRNHMLRIDLEQKALEERYAEIAQNEKKSADEKAKAEAEAARKSEQESKKLADAEAKEAERLSKEKAEAAEKALEVQREIAEIEEEGEMQRIAAQQAGIGQASTALGTFKFDTYTDEQKRKNDEQIVKGINQLVATTRAGGGFF